MAGLAKINYDWLVLAMPLSIWLPAQDHLPVIGPFLRSPITAYLFSWCGMLYDLFIPLLLCIARFRVMAYLAVLVFHLATGVLFQIGMFPLIMVGATLIFFSPAWHDRVLSRFEGTLGIGYTTITSGPRMGRVVLPVFFVWFLIQIALPFRHLMYPGDVFWHEQGYRFSWRVMLMEKAGYAQFVIRDKSGRSIEVDNADFLTPVQEKMMSTQPDLMLQYAQFLKSYYMGLGVDDPSVHARVYVTLNGRPSTPYVSPETNLANFQDGFEPRSWLLPSPRQAERS
ncbi:MAG: hypothetical protein Kow0075_11880 [Salibacteraceae bacterium]